MKTPVVLAALSAGLVAADMLPQPSNFPACGSTCFNNMLAQASQLGCGSGGSTENAVDGVCLCKNLDFTYGIIDCSNAACPDKSAAVSVVQYGIDWCANQGVVVGGISVTADPSAASSGTVTVSATPSSSDAATATSSTEVTTTATSSEGVTATTTVTGNPSETTVATASAIPISTVAVVSTLTNSDGSVETTTVGSSTIFSTTVASESTPITDSTTLVTEITRTSDGTTETTSATITVPVSTSPEGGDVTPTESDGGAMQTAAPVGLVAAAGLALLLL